MQRIQSSGLSARQGCKAPSLPVKASDQSAASQDVFEDDGNIHLVMELCTGGSILEHLKVRLAAAELQI